MKARSIETVDPRVRGGDSPLIRALAAVLGRSPRTRGRPLRLAPHERRLGSIPAYAGETSLTSWMKAPCRVDPRVRGGDANSVRIEHGCAGRSPRTRGRHGQPDAVGDGRRSIPAYAGETALDDAAAEVDGVDPRVRGGDIDEARGDETGRGRSPRTRGRRLQWWAETGSMRSIPAYAGETVDISAAMYLPGVDPRVRGGDDEIGHRLRFGVGRSPRTRGRLPAPLVQSLS